MALRRYLESVHFCRPTMFSEVDWWDEFRQDVVASFFLGSETRDNACRGAVIPIQKNRLVVIERFPRPSISKGSVTGFEYVVYGIFIASYTHRTDFLRSGQSHPSEKSCARNVILRCGILTYSKSPINSPSHEPRLIVVI